MYEYGNRPLVIVYNVNKNTHWIPSIRDFFINSNFLDNFKNIISIIMGDKRCIMDFEETLFSTSPNISVP